MSSAEQYAHWVLDPSNAHKTGQYIKLAAKRFLSDLQREDIYFDENEACKIINFGERYCYQWEGDWRGKLIVFEPWQKFAFMQLYGWIRKDNGRRRFNRFFLEIAKKNGKSTMCAVLALFHLFADERINTPKIFTAANNETQAKICVNMAGRIIEQSPGMYQYVEDGEVKLMTYGIHITEVIHKEKDGFIRAFSKESEDKKSKTAGGKHGENASLGLVDEFGLASDYGASGSIETSMASRSEWLMAYLTTSGFNMEGPCYTELRDDGIKVLEGTIEIDNYLPMIFEIDKPFVDGKTQEITIQYLLDNPELWCQCNPNIDISVNRDFLRSQLERAKLRGGTIEVECKTLNFNLWVDSPDTFIDADTWNKNTHGIKEEELLGEECYGGLEIGGSNDLSCIAFLFPGEIVKIKMLFIAAEEALKLNDTFLVNKNYIKADPGNVLDNDVAIEWIIEEIQKYNMNSFCFFKPHENNSIVQGLIKTGYTGNPISQGLSAMASPTDEWEKLLKAGKVEHFGNPILRWMNSNCQGIKKQGGTRIEKNGKVLGIYACINALAQWKTITANEGTATVDIW